MFLTWRRWFSLVKLKFVGDGEGWFVFDGKDYCTKDGVVEVFCDGAVDYILSNSCWSVVGEVKKKKK